MAGEYLQATPYANPLTGLANDAIQGLLSYMKDVQRTQQMQMLAGLLESTGIPKTVERAAYADSPKALLDALTNVNRANVPLLKPETAEAIMNVAPLVGPAAKAAERGAMAAGRAGERVAEKYVPQIMERGGLPADLLSDLAQGSRRQIFVPASPDEAMKASRMLKTKSPQEVWKEIGIGKSNGEYVKELSDKEAVFNTAEDIAANAQKIRERNAELKQVIKESQSTYPDLFPKELTAARRPLREEIKTNQGLLERNFGYETDPKYTGNLAQIAYEHPSLYEVYPELKGVVIGQGRELGDYLGSYEVRPSQKVGRIEVSKMGLLNNPRSTATHEMQHAVQELAGFEGGGSTDEIMRAAFIDRDAINARIDDLNKQMRQAVGTPEYDNLMEQRMALTKEYLDKGYSDMSTVAKQAYDKYQRLAGEAQARLAQNRLELTPEERLQYYPFELKSEKNPYGLDVAPEKLIYRNLLDSPSSASMLETAEPKAAQSLLDTSYRGSHTAPNPEFGAPLYDLTGGGQMYPADVYSSKAVQYYGTGYTKADKEAFALANKVRGNPDAEVTMYRAVPKDAGIEAINKGDWVTLSKDYAKNHGESVLDNNYKIISQKVKAKDLWTNADSIQEFGYWPE